MNNLNIVFNKKTINNEKCENKIDIFKRIESLTNIKTIIDVGVRTETKELRIYYKNIPHILIESYHDFKHHIMKNYKDNKYELITKAAGDKEGNFTLQVRYKSLKNKQSNLPNHTTISDINKWEEKEGHYIQSIKVDVITLDSIYKKYQSPFLLKIDVDGNEIDVLKGSKELLESNNVQIIVIEAGKRCLEIYNLIKKYNYELFDACDITYRDGKFKQCDFVFINKNLL